MHLSNNQSEQVLVSTLTNIRSLVTAIALSITACVSPQNHQFPTKADKITECDIDNPLFITLVWLSAELQASMECDPNSRSLQYVWTTVMSRMKEVKISSKDISVSLCAPEETERGFAYIVIDVAGQQMQIFAKDQETAIMRTREMQEFCIEYIRDRVELSLGWNPATQEKLHLIIQDEEKVLEKHRMIAKIQQDESNVWTISFEAEI